MMERQQANGTDPAEGARSSCALFQYQSHAVRVMTGADGESWFVATDVCKALAITNSPDALSRLDTDEKSTIGITDSLIKQGLSDNNLGTRLNLVNESGLYSLILASRKPVAKAFKRWITHEVLPALRKTGAGSRLTP